MLDSVMDIFTETLQFLKTDTMFSLVYFNDIYKNYKILDNDIISFIYICAVTILGVIIGYTYYYYEPIFDDEGNEILDIENQNTTNTNTNITNKPKVINTINRFHNKITYSKPLVGIYTESIMELVKENSNIVEKMISSKYDKLMYWVLLRVQLRNPLEMTKTKFDLHGNHTGNSKSSKFTTKDAFMIIKFIYYNNNKDDINKKNLNFGNIIVNFMNYYNNYSEEKYRTNDFIIVAMSQINENTNPKELYSGLIANEYEMSNYHDVTVKMPNTNNTAGYVLTLPIHQVYDIFLDVFPNVVFETKHYEMDNNNFESWKGISMNELSF